jgi:hypothetical protein
MFQVEEKGIEEEEEEEEEEPGDVTTNQLT